MTDLDHQRRLYLRLNLADGVGPAKCRRLVQTFGGIEEVFRAPPKRLAKVQGVGAKAAAAVAAVDDDAVGEELALAAKAGASVLCVEDDSYPAALKHLDDAPPVLYVLGELIEPDAVALAVVGSRRCTHYGLEQAERFGALLGRAGFTVISGGARGIDAAAHRGSLAAGGRTVAVMGSGLCNLYPRENLKLFRQIADGRGAVISELPMRIDVKAGNFPRRNRIIAGMALGALVVEATRRSGSLITARLAVEQGKEVFAVPGRVDSPFSAGTNQLIADHAAALVQNLEDILDALDRLGDAMKAAGAAEPVKPEVQLTQTESRLLDQLRGMELSLDELVRRCELPVGEATAAMTTLAIKGLIARKPGGIFATRRAQ